MGLKMYTLHRVHAGPSMLKAKPTKKKLPVTTNRYSHDINTNWAVKTPDGELNRLERCTINQKCDRPEP